MSATGKLAGVVLGLAMVAPALAGLEIINDEGMMTLVTEDRLLSTGQEGNGLEHVFDAREETITLISSEQQAYARGSVQDYCGAVDSAMNEAMQGMSPEERQMMQQFMEGMFGGEAQAREVTVEERGPGGEIAGQSTQHYAVYVDGQLYQEVWIAEDDALRQAFGDYDALISMTSELATCISSTMGMGAAGWVPEQSEAYEGLMRKGWLMRSVEHRGGMREEEQVTRIEQREIPDERFEPPAGYRNVSILELIRMQQS